MEIQEKEQAFCLLVSDNKNKVEQQYKETWHIEVAAVRTYV